MLWLILLLCAVLAFALIAFNRLAGMRNVVRNAWADIDVMLKRRADLVPNLVETAKGYSGFEQETLKSITEKRAAIQSGDLSPAQRAEAENELAGRMYQIMAVVESYPELKTSSLFLTLQKELGDAEGKIANSRQYYNAAVRDYNTMIETFPTNVIASTFHFQKAEFFTIDEPGEREVPSAKLES